MDNNFVAGFDGGGTKTAVCIKSLNGKVLARAGYGALNLNGGDEKRIRKTVEEMMEYCGSFAGGFLACRALCIGTAGISNPDSARLLVSQIRESGYMGTILLTGDHETALYGALGSGVGIALIAGTGSICLGRNGAGVKWRTGGWGYRIDDEGSGYAIGRDILAAAVRCLDGRLTETCLKESVMKTLHADTAADISAFAHRADTGKKEVAALARLLDPAVEAGDEAACRIAQRAAEALADLVIPVAEGTGQTDARIALLGSILQKCPSVRSRLEKRLHEIYPAMQTVMPKRDAAEGAADIAADHAKGKRVACDCEIYG